MAEQFANVVPGQSQATLNGAITSGATSLVVSSAALFPGSAQFRVLVESELMLVTAVGGTTFTVSRAQEGTTAAAHASGVTVAHILTAAALVQLRADAVTGVPTAIQWATAATATLSQANNTTASATAGALSVQAANATGATSTGGALSLSSGTGTTAPGAVKTFVGALQVSSLAASASDYVKLGGDDTAGATRVAQTGVIRLPNSGASGLQGRIMARNSIDSTDVSLIYINNNNEVNVGSGATQTSMRGTSTVIAGVGNLIVGMNGNIYIRDSEASGERILFYGSSTTTFTQSFGAGLTPTITQTSTATASATGKPFTIAAQVCTGATSTGGDIVLSLGTGTSANGNLSISNVVTQTSAPSAGGGSALPATPAGYVNVTINGTVRKIAYY